MRGRTNPNRSLLAQKPWIVPIPGTTKLHRLRAPVGSSTAMAISEEARKEGRQLGIVSKSRSPWLWRMYNVNAACCAMTPAS